MNNKIYHLYYIVYIINNRTYSITTDLSSKILIEIKLRVITGTSPLKNFRKLIGLFYI